MFCDLAGSTALSTTLHPEDLRDVLRRYQAAACAVIASHDGFVSAYLGDGLLVQFGYPKVNEDDAERAVRAGCEVAAAVRSLRTLPGLTLDVRVGIATGLTVVGDLIGQGPSRESAVVGRTPNLAARLQALARPGEVIISSTTKRLVGALFEMEDLGPQDLKGFDEPTSAWRVVAERPSEDRFEARHGGTDFGPLVGRDDEYAELAHHWQNACQGHGQVVTVVGEPGIGKSRLSAALQQKVRQEGHLLLRYFCSPRFQYTALYPVIQHIRSTLRLETDDTDATALGKLEAFLMRATPGAALVSTLPYVAAMLSIPTDARYPQISDSPERQREQTLRVLKEHVLHLARDNPVLLVFEDLHWVDATTLQLFEQLVRDITTAPILVLATARTEFTPPWTILAHGHLLKLDRLDRSSRAAIIQNQTGGKVLPPQILQHILDKSDGIPLFVEELTKATMESGLLLEQADQYALNGPMPTNAVPSTLHDSLLARLDRLSVVKEVVQVGAAIGREFSYDMLTTLLPVAPAELQATLSRLIDAELVQQRGKPPDATYTFRHALIQDAAYATMLRGKRRGIHARIAHVLQTRSTVSKPEPELLAHHLTEAGLFAQAIPRWLEAGMAAAARAAHSEACSHFEGGLQLLDQLPDDATRNQLELGLRVYLGVSMAATRGYAAPEVEAGYQRARALCSLMGDTAELYAVLRGLCTFYIVRADLKAARELSEHCVRLGEETQRADFLIEGYTALGYTLTYAGELEKGRLLLAKAVDIYRSRDGASLTYPSPQDPSMACLSLLAMVSWILGQPRKAAAYAIEAVQTAEALQRPFDTAYAHCFAAMFENLQRNSQGAAAHAGITIDISQRHGFAAWLGPGTLHFTIAQGGIQATTETIALLSATLTAFNAAGAESNSCYFLFGLAESYRAIGKLDEALATVEKAIEHAAQHGEHWNDAALFRLRGELVMARGDPIQAEADFRRALDIAQAQGAKAFELRARTSLVALPRSGGAAEREVLEALCAQLGQDGIDSADLREARKLLRSTAV